MSKTTVLASSPSAVQTHLKNNTFLNSFICCSWRCSYLWVVFVSDWNLLSLFSHFASQLLSLRGSEMFMAEDEHCWGNHAVHILTKRCISIEANRNLCITSLQDKFPPSSYTWKTMTKLETGLKFGYCEMGIWSLQLPGWCCQTSSKRQ